MICIELSGGTGSQLFQYSYGRARSLKENVPLRIRLADNYALGMFSGIDCPIVTEGEAEKGQWRSPKYFKEFEGQIRKDLTLRAIEISREAQKLSYKCGLANTVAVHVRNDTPAQYYEDALAVIQEAEKIRLHAFIFAEDVDEATRHLELKKSKNITIVRGMEPWEDLWLMACCRHMILSNSAFSWWAGFGNMRAGIKIIPKSVEGMESWIKV